MAEQYFKVPERYGGMSVRDIHNQLLKSGVGTGVGDLGTFAKFLGVGETEPLQTGRTFGTGGFAPQYVGTSSEWKGLTSAFDPTDSPEEARRKAEAAAFQEEQRARLGEFTGKLGEIPTQLEAVRKALGLPEAYETFGKAGELARGVAQRVEELPETVGQAALGRDVSASQLERMIAAKTMEATPALTEASRALTGAEAGLGRLISQYGVETEQIFTPLQIEAGMLGESMKSEFDLFKTRIGADLDRELEQMRQTGAMDRAQLDRATRLAEIEQMAEKDELQAVNLGDRVALYNPYTGEEISSFGVGLKPKRGTTDDGW